jgi:oxygen-independent coproporphyrinogen-3 oxidase
VVLSQRLTKGEVALPPDEVVVSMADALADTLESAGLAQYEISNFARVGFTSRHNRRYWMGEDCLALGCGAVGFVCTGKGEAQRYANVRRAEDYLTAVERGFLPEAARERLGPSQLCLERVMTGLRLREGIDLRSVLADFGQTWGGRREEVARLQAQGLLIEQDGRIALTRRGRHLHSEISARLG